MEKLMILILAIAVILIITFAGVSLYCFITYGSSPITEIPFWALIFMFGEN